uniref:Uncharacterized protein n=1 Tax=Arundo donax TaxID=35708 RepID=A0A0A8XPX6_ARUDO
MSIPGNGHLPASASLPDHSTASDSDAEPEADYRPISGAASDSDSDPESDAAVPHHRLGEIGNGISALDLASDEEEEAFEGEEDEEGDEDMSPVEAAARAFSEDERRRRAPLPAGAAARIVDAMRGVEFPGAPPPWAGSVPEDQWLDRLSSLRTGRPN